MFGGSIHIKHELLGATKKGWGGGPDWEIGHLSLAERTVLDQANNCKSAWIDYYILFLLSHRSAHFNS